MGTVQNITGKKLEITIQIELIAGMEITLWCTHFFLT